MSSKAVMAATVLVLSSSPGLAHDLYTDLKDSNGRPCCDDHDCRPALFRFTATGVQMYVDQHWIEVPDWRIEYRVLPGDTGETDGGHWCGYREAYSDDRWGADPLKGLSVIDGFVHVTYCAVLPPQSH